MDDTWIPDITISSPEISGQPIIDSEAKQEIKEETVNSTNEEEPANMDQNWAKKMNMATKERENVARIVWLLMDAGTFALRSTFDSVHPPLNLRDHLTQAHVKAVLQRLHTSNVINDKTWEMLYPVNKKNTSSQQYDSRTLCILLQSICHLCPPYPNGWGIPPLPTDSSLSADIVRLQLLHQKVAGMDMITPEEYASLWNQIKDVLTRLGGPPIRVRLHRIEHETITTELQNHYVNVFQEQWADGRKLIMTPKSNASKKRGRSLRNKNKEENGIPKEDRVVLQKTYKMFVDNIQAEDILDRLQQNQVLKFSERQDILSHSKNSERMQIILDKIHSTKLSFGFKALCDSIKFKYKKLYDIVMAIRKEVYKHGVKDTIDVIGICRDSLYQIYKTLFAKCHPFAWAENVSVNIRDLYIPLDLLDSNGKRLHLSEFFPPLTDHNGKGKRIVLEGSGGSGKSILCAMITYLWGTNKNYFKYNYNILLYVDLATIQGDFKSEVYHKLFPDDFKVKQEDFWATMEENSHEVVFLIDSYNGKTDMRDLQEILSGVKLPQATIIVATNPDISHTLGFTPDTKLFNMGYSSHCVTRCMKTYLYHFKAHPEKHQHFLDLLENESWELHRYLSQPIVCLLLFAIYQTNKSVKLDEIDGITGLFEIFGLSMATHYCKKQKIDVIGYEFPEDIVSAINQLCNFAFETLRDGKRAFLEEEIPDSINAMIFQFGAFFKLSGPYWKFTCSLMQDFLAARRMSDFVLDEMSEKLKDNKMMKYSRYSQMITLLCGLFRFDHDTSTINSLFTDLAVRNITNTRVNFDDVRSVRSVDSESSVSNAPNGKLIDYNVSLQSLTECDFREDACEIIAQSLPARIIIKRDGLIPSRILQALPLVMTGEGNRITFLELVLLPSYTSQTPVYTELATGVAKTGSIKNLKIHWSTLDLMARFLEAFMAETKSIDSVVLSENSKKSHRNISADTWATLQNACEGMTKTKEFSFLNAKVAAIAYFVLQHLPTTIEELNFTGCKLNMMCASELSYKLEHAKSLTKLDITNTQLAGSDFVAVLQGLKLCPTIRHLKLCGAKLDRQGVVTLSECLRLTRSLQILDLSNCELGTDMCILLADAIADNRTLQRLILKNTKVTLEGKSVISHTKLEQLKVVGLEDSKNIIFSM